MFGFFEKYYYSIYFYVNFASHKDASLIIFVQFRFSEGDTYHITSSKISKSNQS